MPQRLRTAILALGEAAVPELIAVLQDEDLADAEGPHGGWAPIHAADLLIALRASDAIEPLLDMLMDSDFDAIIHSRIELGLPRLGAAVLEPALARLSEAVDDLQHPSLCGVLARLPVKDERVYLLLVRLFERDKVLGAIFLADYGDPRGVPLLAAAIRDLDSNGRHATWAELGDLAESYEILAGSLPDDLRAKVNAAHAAWHEARAVRSQQDQIASAKVGRNDACPCGSGKKFKRCCLGAASL